MARRKFIFRDGNVELMLPVTPKKFEISHGMNVEVVNIHSLGDINLFGYPTLTTIKIDCMFPAKNYLFSNADRSAYSYVEVMTTWMSNKTVLRFIIPDTAVNIPIRISDITYGEPDGTNDVSATLTLKEYRKVMDIQIESSNSINHQRESAVLAATPATYTVVIGDTLNSICRRFYGDANLYTWLAASNDIANPNLITVGQVIALPDRGNI